MPVEAHRIIVTRSVDVPVNQQALSGPARDVAVDAAGRIYMLDARQYRLDVFSEKGALIDRRSLGTPGSADAIHGHLLTAVGDNGVLVYDATANRVHEYRFEHNRLEHARVIAIAPQTLQDMCAVGDIVYTLTYRADEFLHAYSLNSGGSHSFGTPPGSNRFVRSAIVDAGGRLACFARQRVVVISLRASGRIFGFRLDGRLLWTYDVPDFHGLGIRTRADSTVELSTAAPVVDRVSSIFPVGPSDVALQIGRRSAAHEPIRTLVLRVADGKLVGSQANLPYVRRANEHLLVTAAEPSRFQIRVNSYTF